MQQLLLHTTVGWIDLALLIGRAFIGVCFMVHGLGKLGIVGSGNMNGFVSWLKGLGVPMPEVQARIAMLSELTGGAMIATGLGMRVGAVLCLGTMLVAATIGHRGGGYLITNNPPGNEYTINLAAILVMFILIGPGAYSFDHMLFGNFGH